MGQPQSAPRPPSRRHSKHVPDDLLTRVAALATTTTGHGSDAARRALVWLDDKGKEERVLTFGEVGAQASAIAKGILQDKCGLAVGDKVLLVFAPGTEFIVAFLACLLAGCVAVPIYPPDPRNPAKGMAKLLAAVEVTEPKIALSHQTFLRAKRLQVLSGKGPKYPRGLGFHSVTSVLRRATFDPKLFAAAAGFSSNRLAFVQFSSGSTGAPKAVAISMGNLNANLSSIERCFGATKDTVAVSWVPFYHDMGLVGGICHGLYVGAEHVTMSPITFLRRPFTWLEAISNYRATITTGVNFAYEMVVNKVKDAEVDKLDLRDCTRYSNGAEPVRASTLRAFVEKFGRCGVKMAYMDPIYGGAENVVFFSNRPGNTPREPLFLKVNGAALGMGASIQILGQGDDGDVSSSDGDGDGDDGAVVELVGNGEPGVTTKIISVDPVARKALGPDVVGELWSAGPSKAMGYFLKKGGDLDTSAFTATLHGPEDGDGSDCGTGNEYYRTGDLGFLHQGRVFVCGRLKDMLIINGQNVFPQDIEHAVSKASDLVRPGCVIVVGVESATTGEAAVAIAEVRDVSVAAQEAWYDATQDIKKRVMVETGVALEQIHFIRPRTIPKTTSGKVQRAEAKRKLLKGTLASVFALGASSGGPLSPNMPTPAHLPPPPLGDEDACVKWLCVRAADILTVDTVGAEDDVHEMGITSVGIVAMAEALEELSGFTRAIDDMSAFFTANVSPIQMVEALIDLPASDGTTGNRRVEQSLPPLRHVRSRRLGPCAMMLLQLLGICFICMLVFVAVLPSYHFVYWVLFTLNEDYLSFIRLWDDVFQFGVLVALAQPLFLFSFTVLVILLKWLVIGRHKSGTSLDLTSLAFYRWWLVDRAMYVWHTVVGAFIEDTPLANIFLILMGADVAMSAKIGSMPSNEFDLIHVGAHASLDGRLLARAFDAKSRSLRMRRIRIGDGAHVQTTSMVLLGAHVHSDTVVEPLAVVLEGGHTLSKRSYAGNPAALQPYEAGVREPAASHWSVDLAKKLTVMLLTLYAFGAASTASVVIWGVLGYPTHIGTPLAYWASHFFITGLVFSLLAIVTKHAIFAVSRGPLARFTVDFQYKAAYLVFLPIFEMTRSISLLLRLYGASVGTNAFIADVTAVKASVMDNLVLGKRTFLAACTFRGGATGKRRTKTTVAPDVEVSLGAVVDSGAHVGKHTAPRAHIKSVFLSKTSLITNESVSVHDDDSDVDDAASETSGFSRQSGGSFVSRAGSFVAGLLRVDSSDRWFPGGDFGQGDLWRTWDADSQDGADIFHDYDDESGIFGDDYGPRGRAMSEATVVTEPVRVIWPACEEALILLFRLLLYAWFALMLVPAYAYAVWVLYGDFLYWLPDSERSPLVENRSLAIVLLFPSLLLATVGFSLGYVVLAMLLPKEPVTGNPRTSVQCSVQNTASVIERILLPLLHGTVFYNAHARLLGAKVGRGVFLYSSVIREHGWHEYGDGCVIDSAWVMGHQFSRGELHNGRIRIGASSTVHPASIVFAGLATNDGESLAHGKLAVHAHIVAIADTDDKVVDLEIGPASSTFTFDD